MYKRILMPMDGSSYSKEIIPFARTLAAGRDTELVLMSVVQKESDRAEAAKALQPLAEQWDAAPYCEVATGDVADAILREAGRVPGTLVAMTSRGHSGVMESVLGSVALRVVRGNSAPTLVYHPLGTDAAEAPGQVQHIVLPLDGTPLSEAMAEPAAKLARDLDAELFLLEVINPKDAARAGSGASSDVMRSAYVRATARELAQRWGVKVNWDTLNHTDPAAAISSFVEGRSGVILAMATRGRRGLQSTLLGSVASGCLRRSGVPVLMQVP